MSGIVSSGTLSKRLSRGRAQAGTVEGGLPATTTRSRGRSISQKQAMQAEDKNTIRLVTPDTLGERGGEGEGEGEGEGGRSTPENKSDRDNSHIQASPRTLLSREIPSERRLGVVFQDSDDTELPSKTSRSRRGSNWAPPIRLPSRPRTNTVHERSRQHSTSSGASNNRGRVGSMHSAMSAPYHDVEPRLETSNVFDISSIAAPAPPPQLQKSNSTKANRRLVQKASRTASSLAPTIDVPTIDSLPSPVASNDIKRLLMLMKTMYGRMRGEVEHQTSERKSWSSGVCYIDEDKGSLIYDGDDRGPFDLILIPDLRGCRVQIVQSKVKSRKCLQISVRQKELLICPMVEEEFDLWLAGLLCWQEVRNGPLPANPLVASDQSSDVGRSPNIIKVAKLLLWDNGPPSSPAAIMRRPSTGDPTSPSRSSWRKVSCILEDNGEFKLLEENDVTLLSVIQLWQLSRSAIQRLDKSVLGEKFCVALFPLYASTSTQLSIFRPVYLAFESRIPFEVWFSLLRAFSIPEIYGPELSQEQDASEEAAYPPCTDGMFRIEKSLNLRIVEGRVRRPRSSDSSIGHSTKSESGSTVGDYFVEATLDGEIRARTITKHNTQYPFWREEYEILHLPASLPVLTLVLKRTTPSEVMPHKLFSSSSVNVAEKHTEVVCRTLELPLDKLEKGKDHETWFPILDDRNEQAGDLFLKIRVDEVAVLLSRDYQDISDLLHRFTAGLTERIAQAMPTNLRRLSEILINIFEVSGQVGEWLLSLVEEEIDGITKEIPTNRIRWSRRVSSNEAAVSERELSVRDMGKSLQGEANLLFRGNSLLTQALDFHMRRLGNEYLETVLCEKLSEINSLNADCEVDPSRISQGGDINKNWARLTTFTTEIWESIAESVDECPPQMRQILKYIRAVAEDRYGNFLRTVSYTSVSGFLFLRFFCPALLNPKLFGLLPDAPQSKAQRTLTLIAKSLQALANLSTFGQKEEWMTPMNKFLISHRQAIKGFIDQICSIPSMGSQVFAPSPSYSTPITVHARLPPPAKEGFPSLPFLIDHGRNFAALVTLWLDAIAHHTPPSGTEGDLLHFHELCVDLQRRTNECLRQAEGDRQVDEFSPEAGYAVHDMGNREVEEAVTTVAESYRPPKIERPSDAQRSIPGSSGGDTANDEKQEEYQFEGKENKSRKKKKDATDSSAKATSSEKCESRSSKQYRNLFGVLKKKGKGDGLGVLVKDRITRSESNGT